MEDRGRSAAPKPGAWERTLPLLAGAVVAATILALFADVWIGSGGLPADVVPGGDASFVGTVYERAAVQVRELRAPLWFHEFDCGAPTAAAWMYGLLSPGMLLFAFLPLGAAFAWTAALHAAFGAAGMARFLGRNGCDGAGALAGALLFGISEHFVGRTLHGHVNLVAPIAWAPWILVFVHAAARGERRAVPLLALCTGAGLLAGHVQVWIVLAPALVAYAAAEAWSAELRGAAATRIASAGLLGAGIAGAQIAITAELLTQAAPPVREEGFLRATSVPPAVVLSKLVASWIGPPPDASGAAAMDGRPGWRGIAGAWAFALAMFGVVRGAPRRWIWSAAALVGMLAAIGVRSPSTAWLQDVVPFSWTRTPSRWLMLPLVAVPVLAGYGLARLPLRRTARWAVAGAAGVLALTLGIPAVRSRPAGPHRLDWAPAWPPAAREHRVVAPEILWQWANVEAAGLRTTRAPAPVRLAGQASLFAMRTPALGWWLDLGAEIVPNARAAEGAPEAEDLVGATVREHAAMGPAAFFGSAVTGTDPAEIQRRIAAGERALFLPADAAAEPSEARGSVLRATWTTDELALEVECSGAGWLLVSMNAYPGWHAEVDGAEARVVRGNLAFPVVRIASPGRHRVILRYRPASFRWGVAVTCVSLAIAGFLLVRRAPQSEADEPAAR